MEKKYYIMSLCGDKIRTVTEEELNAMDPMSFGYNNKDLLRYCTNPQFNDWGELAFLVEENIIIPTTLEAKDIYKFIASWCVNTAFGNMENPDSVMTIKDFAEQLDSVDEEKAKKFRETANEDYYKGQFKELNWDDFWEIISDDEFPDDIDMEDENAVEEARSKLEAEREDYNIKSYIRDLTPPFEPDNEKVMQLFNEMASNNFRIEEHTWY